MAGRNLFASTSSAPSVPPVPQEASLLDELGRQAARTLRSGATGIASVLDTPRIVTDPLYTAGYYGAKALGAPEAQEFFRQELARPTYGQMTKEKIDEVTGGVLKPRNKIEQFSDVGSEFLVSAMTPDVITKGAKTIGGMVDKAKLPSVDDIKAASQKIYDEVLNSGVTFGDDFSKGMAESTKKFLPKTKVQKTVLAGSPATQYASRFQKFSGKPMTIEDIDLIDKDLTDEIYSLSVSKPNEARKLSDIQDAFRESIGKQPVAKDLAKARDLWAQQAKMRDITKIMDNAALTDNPAKSIQTAFRGLLRNEKRMKGFTAEERKLIGKAAKTGNVIDAMRIAGSRLNTIAVGAATGNIPLAAATFVGGTGARGIAETMQRAKGENVLRAIAERPIGEVIPAIGNNTVPNLTQAVITGGAASLAQPEPAIKENMPQQPIEPQSPPSGRNLFAREPIPQLPATIPDTLPQSIKENEGYSPISYKDTEGYTTVGHGINLDSGIARKAWKQTGIQTPFDDVYNGKATITPQESAALGNYMMRVAVEDADAIYPKMQRLSAPQQEALTELAYNLGRQRLAGMRQFNEAINKGDKINAIRHLMRSKWVTQVGKRRARQIASKLLMET